MAPALVVVGTSLGGLHALQVLLGGLPGDWRVPLAVVQHRGREPGDGLSEVLRRHCRLPVSEAEDKEPLRAGHVYLAPADYHLLIESTSLALSTEGRIQHARPSIDALFESAADAYAEKLIGVVLTGASDDGARGAARIKERGGAVIVQDPASSESGVMPGAALAATRVDRVLPLEQIAGFLVRLCSGRDLDRHG